MLSYMIELNRPVDTIGYWKFLQGTKKIYFYVKSINYPISIFTE